ncbi:MAG: iron-sulfur cluster assembly scaffold protein [Christensenellales bacterium]
MDHFMHPRNVGEIDNASGVGTVGNAKCGDIMRIFLDIDENQIVRDAKFETFGCSAWRDHRDQLDGDGDDYRQRPVTGGAGGDQQGGRWRPLGGLPPVKVHCSLLAEQAVHAALWDYAQKNHITIEGLKPPVNDVDELEEAHKDEA